MENFIPVNRIFLKKPTRILNSMKRIFIFALLSLIFLLTKCAGDVYKKDKSELVQTLSSMNLYTVPVKENLSTVVTFGEDTLTVTNTPINIYIPNVLNRFDSLKLDTTAVDTNNLFSQYTQTILFEDIESGDYDFNDLVIYIKNKCKYLNNKDYFLQSIEIQPIALGTKQNIKLGCVLSNGSEYIISNNVREELFNNHKGYINTISGKGNIKFKSYLALDSIRLNKDSNPYIAWFIEINKARYYSVCSEINYEEYNMFGDKDIPYGLVFYNTFTYPEEGNSIFEVYKDFYLWRDGKRSSIGEYSESKCYKY